MRSFCKEARIILIFVQSISGIIEQRQFNVRNINISSNHWDIVTHETYWRRPVTLINIPSFDKQVNELKEIRNLYFPPRVQKSAIYLSAEDVRDDEVEDIRLVKSREENREGGGTIRAQFRDCSSPRPCTLSENVWRSNPVDVDKWPLVTIKSRLKQGHGRADECSPVLLASRKSVLMGETCAQSVPGATRRPRDLLEPLHPLLGHLLLCLHQTVHYGCVGMLGKFDWVPYLECSNFV